jgi:uncharacterized membrane protein YccC
MSTEAVASLPRPASRARWRSDARIVRTLRFALGVWAASLLAFVVQWPLFFLTPVLAAFFLSLPLPAPTGWNAVRVFWQIVAAFALGLVFSQFLLAYPMVFLVALGLALFHSYYRLNRGGSVLFAVVSLIALLLLPMLALSHQAVSEGAANWFVVSAGLAVLTYLLAHRLLPDPDGTRGLPPGRGFKPDYSPPAARAALKSTLAVMPIALLFLTMQLTGEILVMIFAAIFSLSPQAAKGREAGLNSLTSTLIGGGVAVLLYALIVAVPSIWFFAVLLAITVLGFGAAIFSGRPYAKYMASAMIAVLILIGGAMGEDVDFADKLATRIVLIGLATLWVVGALRLLEHWLDRPATETAP